MTEILGLNAFDIVVIGLILLLSIKGLLNGFTKELFGAIGLIGGIFVASYFHKGVAEYIHSNVTDALSVNALNLLSLIILFILFFTIVKYIGKGVALIGDSEYISATSRLGGMLIKIVTLFFIFSLIVFAFSSKPQVTEKFKDTLDNSKLYPLLKSTGANILNMPIISDVNLSKKTSKQDSNKDNKTVDSNTTKAEETNSTTDVNSTNIKEESKTVEQNSTSANEEVKQEEKNATVETESTKKQEEPKSDAVNTQETNSTKAQELENNSTSEDANSTKN